MSTLLVTGGTGFVGRNCLIRAIQTYDKIYAPVRSEKKLREQFAAEGISTEKIQTLPNDPDAWPELDIDHAILSAGVLFARTRQEYFDTNVDWILKIARTLPANCRTVILSSQSAGGPTPAGVSSRSEAEADSPITWYGESKLAMEKAIRTTLPGRAITILRPPMVLGARDLATLPLFRMGKNPLRIKPGLETKTFSFIAVDDLVDAIFTTLNHADAPPGPYYVASPTTITDRELIMAASHGRPGATIAVPQMFVKLLSFVVDAIPPLRTQTPSLTKDRAREIWANRWVVNGASFEKAYQWQARQSLTDAMNAAREFYLRSGLL